MTGCKRPLLGMTLPELEAVVKEAGLRPFAAKQMARRLYVGRAKNIDEMTELPKSARLWFAERYTIGRSVPKLESRSADGTVKYLFATRGEGVDYLTHGEGGRDVEAVYIPDKDRATLCVSSQAGCRMGCRFCMTGRQGYHGDLSSAGIINQILSIPESESLTNIVFMGMGEPMDNVAEVLKAVEVLTAPWGLAWEMTRLGLPIPQGFTVTTEACTDYYNQGKKISEEIEGQIFEALEGLEKKQGKKFGDTENPLLVSVRSGARASMPGMMDTILNLGLTDVAVEGFAKKTGNPRFAYDSYRRFIQMF